MIEDYKIQVAENFDARLDYDKDNLRARLAGRLIDIARPQQGEQVLDIATGTGLAAIPTARLVGRGAGWLGWTSRSGCWIGRRKPSRRKGCATLS